MSIHLSRQHDRLGEKVTVQCVTPPPRAPRSGASNLDAIIDKGTLTIGWVGPALLGILIAAFGWAGRVFEWLGTLATSPRYKIEKTSFAVLVV